MVEALKRQFHSSADVWLLCQKLNTGKQLATESVTVYAADIRRTSRKINLPNSETVNYFIQGLKPALKAYVLLQQPDTIEAAENHAKLRESAPDPAMDKMDQVISLLTAPEAKVAACESATTSSPPEPITRDDIVQIVRQEMRRSTNPNQRFGRGPPHRNQRSYWWPTDLFRLRKTRRTFVGNAEPRTLAFPIILANSSRICRIIKRSRCL